MFNVCRGITALVFSSCDPILHQELPTTINLSWGQLLPLSIRHRHKTWSGSLACWAKQLPWQYHDVSRYTFCWITSLESATRSSATSIPSTCFAFRSMAMDWLSRRLVSLPWNYTPASVLAIIIMLIRLTEVDSKQLETAEPPVPELCDHSYKRCNGCWKGYPQSRFQNWTQGQIKKAKIYNIIHNYSKIKPCVYYRVDVNDRGLFTHTREITTVYGDEDIIWDNLVHEKVSW